jgi:hypothetical protein
MASTSVLKERLVPTRRAAASAGKYAEADDSDTDDVLTPQSSPPKSAKPKPKGRAKAAPKAAPKATPKSKTPKRRKLSPELDADSDDVLIIEHRSDQFHGSLSPLTPLRASPAKPSPREDATASPSPLPPPQRRLARPAFGAGGSVGSGIVASLRQIGESRALGRFVWARVDAAGELAGKEADGTDAEGMWWPAEVSASAPPRYKHRVLNRPIDP